MTKTPEQWISGLDKTRWEPVVRLRNVINEHLPEGFEETVGYGMLGWVVPHRIYPQGYHTNPQEPLPFMNLALQKNYISLYHMGLYADPDLLWWFTEQFPRHSQEKLNMGRSCIRFRNPRFIPYDLIGELCERITPEQWVRTYETMRKKG